MFYVNTKYTKIEKVPRDENGVKVVCRLFVLLVLEFGSMFISTKGSDALYCSKCFNSEE